jgi:hypothetical protein
MPKELLTKLAVALDGLGYEIEKISKADGTHPVNKPNLELTIKAPLNPKDT